MSSSHRAHDMWIIWHLTHGQQCLTVLLFVPLSCAYVPTTTHLFSSLQRPRQKYSHEEGHAVFFLYSWAWSMVIIIEKLFYKVQERTEDNLNRPELHPYLHLEWMTQIFQVSKTDVYLNGKLLKFTLLCYSGGEWPFSIYIRIYIVF